MTNSTHPMTKLAMPAVPAVSTLETKGMFGPMWHGTTPENMGAIREQGFKINVEEARQGDTRHGFPNENLPGKDFPYPVHFLGFGVYFTTNQTIAKEFNQKSTRGLKANTFYLNSDRILEINFASPDKMTQWWIDHGYDPELAKTDRVAATVNMTQQLSSECDAVFFKGSNARGRLLDGNQVCVYDPSKIVRMDVDLSPTVIRKADGMRGTLLDTRTHQWTPKVMAAEGFRPGDGQRRVFLLDKHPWVADAKPGQVIQDQDGENVQITNIILPEPQTVTYLTVKWKKGGTDANVKPEWVDIIYPDRTAARARSMTRLASHLDAQGQYDLADRMDKMAKTLPSGIGVKDLDDAISRTGLPPYLLQMMGLHPGQQRMDIPSYEIPEDMWNKGQQFKGDYIELPSFSPLAKLSWWAKGIDDDLHPRFVRNRGEYNPYVTMHESTHARGNGLQDDARTGNPSASLAKKISYTLNKAELEAQLHSMILMLHSNPNPSYRRFHQQFFGEKIGVKDMAKAGTRSMGAILWNLASRVAIDDGITAIIKNKNDIIEAAQRKFIDDHLKPVVVNAANGNWFIRRKIKKLINDVRETLPEDKLAELTNIIEGKPTSASLQHTDRMDRIAAPIMDLYHGTDDPELTPEDLEPRYPSYRGGIGEGIYFGTKPETAEFYGKNILHRQMNVENPLIIDGGEMINYRYPPDMEEEWEDSGVPSILVGEWIPPFDALIGGEWCEIRSGYDLENIGRWAEDAGHDAVILRNVRWTGGSAPNEEILVLPSHPELRKAMTKEALRQMPSGAETEDLGSAVSRLGLPPQLLQTMRLLPKRQLEPTTFYRVPHERMTQYFEDPNIQGFNATNPEGNNLSLFGEALGLDHTPPDEFVMLHDRSAPQHLVHETTHRSGGPLQEDPDYDDPREISQSLSSIINYIISNSEMAANLNAIIAELYAKPNTTLPAFIARSSRRPLDYSGNNQSINLGAAMKAILWGEIKQAIDEGGLYHAARNRERIIEDARDEFVRGPLTFTLNNVMRKVPIANKLMDIVHIKHLSKDQKQSLLDALQSPEPHPDTWMPDWLIREHEEFQRKFRRSHA